jgi:hypothetical protein
MLMGIERGGGNAASGGHLEPLQQLRGGPEVGASGFEGLIAEEQKGCSLLLAFVDHFDGSNFCVIDFRHEGEQELALAVRM